VSGSRDITIAGRPQINRDFVVSESGLWVSSGDVAQFQEQLSQGGMLGTRDVIASRRIEVADRAAFAHAATVATGSALPDLSDLPVASGQSASSLPAALASAGGMAPDPITGAITHRVTDRSTPVSNQGATVEYADGPCQISRETSPGSGVHIGFYRLNPNPDTLRLYRFERGVGVTLDRAFTATGLAAVADLQTSFAKKVSEPTHIYQYAGGQLRRRVIDPDTLDTDLDESGTNFPVSMNSGLWLSQDRNDEWFVKINSANAVYRFRASTGLLASRNFPGLDEPHIFQGGAGADRAGCYVITDSGRFFWDLENDTLSNAEPSSVENAHPAGMLDWLNGVNAGNGRIFRLQQVGSNLVFTENTSVFAPSNTQHCAGQWVDQYDTHASADKLLAWAFWTTFAAPFAQATAPFHCVFVNGYGDTKVLSNNYHASSGTDYWGMPKGNIAPDAKVAQFTAFGSGSPGNHDVMIVEVPLASV